jgi:hypothetical protein
MSARLPAILSSLLLGACSVVGIRSGTEEPRFETVETIGAVEIRRYAARIAAQTEVPGTEEAARNEGFRRLAGYIFGGNARRDRIAMTAPVAQAPGERIAMTAPVAQTGDSRGWQIRFFMPARYTLDTLPVPDDRRVALAVVPEEMVAVLRFSGLPRGDAVARNTAALTAALDASSWAPAGPVQAWFYDPPWTVPALRRNEIAVPVAPREPG